MRAHTLAELTEMHQRSTVIFLVQTGELLMTGDFAKVRVTGALEYDLIGELADEYTE